MTQETNDLNGIPWEARIASFNSLISSAHFALRNAVLINGAAAVAMMAYLGSGPYHTAFAWSLGLFAFGVFCSVLASAGAYLAQHEYHNELNAMPGLKTAAAEYTHGREKYDPDTMTVEDARMAYKKVNELYERAMDAYVGAEWHRTKAKRWHKGVFVVALLSYVSFCAGSSAAIVGFRPTPSPPSSGMVEEQNPSPADALQITDPKS